MTTIDTVAIVQSFTTDFGGTVVAPPDDTYEAARVVWNGMVGARPLLIAQCRTVDDIVGAVRLSHGSDLPIAVRGGGHSVAGLSTCDGGVVVDLSGMRNVTVDERARVAVVEPGATWADLDAASARHGLATTGGLVSSTGVAGLTLGGGIGWLQRKFGLACDNLVAADVVTAAGDVVHASESERPELLWGLRGGGGNFGIVASFTFALHPVSTVIGGLMAYPIAQGRQVLRTFRDWARDLPDEGSMLAAILYAPPEPFVPADLVGKPVVAILGCWCGDLDAGMTALEPLRSMRPAVDVFGPLPYPALNSMLDGGAPAGLRNYFRGGYVADLTDDVIDVALDHGVRMPSPMSQIHFHQMGGAVGRVPMGATAFSGRDAGYTYNVISTWAEPAEDEQHLRANRELAAALSPLSMGRAYVNFQSDRPSRDGGRGDDHVATMYGTDVYDRLARLKREYDPSNVFHLNQNVPPAR
jgi:FAD binding domain/Berberine and berberine like